MIIAQYMLICVTKSPGNQISMCTEQFTIPVKVLLQYLKDHNIKKIIINKIYLYLFQQKCY